MAAASRPALGTVVALWIVAVVAAVWFLREASELLIPIVIGVLISFVLEPVVAWLARHHIPRIAGTSILMLSLLGLTGWGVYSLRDDAMHAVEALPRAAQHARDWLTSQPASGSAAKIREAAAILQGQETAPGEPSTSAPAQETGGEQGMAGLSVPALVQQGVGSIFALAGNLTVIVFLVFFLLVAGHHFRRRIVEIVGPDADRRKRAIQIIDEINDQIQRFMLVRLVTATIVALLTWVVLAWMGVENAAFWALLAGVFNSIPYFGPVIVSGGLLLVGLTEGGGITRALQMSGAALAITTLEGWIITPPLLGKAERMSVIAVFLGLLVWTWIWGAWGTILAVPMLVVLKAVADHLPPLRRVGRLLAP